MTEIEGISGNPRVVEFLEKLQPGQIAPVLFQAMPDVIFWIKDKEGIIIFVNDAFVREMGKRTASEVVGKTDRDLSPSELVAIYEADDLHVMTTGEAIWNKTELISNSSGGVEWRATSKVPLYDREGVLIGTAGLARKVGVDEGLPVPTQHRDIASIIGAIYKTVDRDVKVSDLAEAAGMSVSTLERTFKEHMGTTPKQFIIQAKISTACERLLGSQMSVKEVGASVGYTDHANFTRGFRKIMNMSPTEYRRSYKRK
ncbi:AraC-type DNA-binding protein [Rubritalea squalenifaciens DSM 18772]|uniref:AraC-type DNA-binding protein n=2 Tax=Rubritalea TaxID=361050 RepID=A0A1M6HF73_9BACT|nr:helix-turn-helix domain-containing protein [Rubritalea squalenifaciens]SHJ20861.1 AraC-type DNA-binding protein [Rubritalea squalenifaciens DSM 18772]